MDNTKGAGQDRPPFPFFRRWPPCVAGGRRLGADRAMARIGVLGIGNVLMGDDALGPYVVKLLDARYELGPEVEVMELGTPGADLSLHLDGLDAAVVVDTVKLRGEPGEVRLLDQAQLLAKKPLLPASPHEPGLREALFALQFSGGGPADVRLVGVIPAAVELEVGL